MRFCKSLSPLFVGLIKPVFRNGLRGFIIIVWRVLNVVGTGSIFPHKFHLQKGNVT